MDKPPLGLMPKWQHIEHRIRDIMEAMSRYQNVYKIVPILWIDELRDLYEDLDVCKDEWKDEIRERCKKRIRTEYKTPVCDHCGLIRVELCGCRMEEKNA